MEEHGDHESFSPPALRQSTFADSTLYAAGNQPEPSDLPAERLVATYNSLPGVTPVKKFKTAPVAASKIWARIEKMGRPEEPKAKKAEQPKPDKKGKSGAQSAQKAPAKTKPTTKATAAKTAPKAKTAAKLALRACLKSLLRLPYRDGDATALLY